MEVKIPFITKAKGCFLEDEKGNRYIDVTLGAGTHILGHVHPIIVEAIERQVKNGTLYILPNQHSYEVINFLSCAIGHFDSFVFCNSGTEATMRAVRIGRAYTGKKKIAMFGGGWHGGSDMLLFEEDYSSNENQPLAEFISAGTPKEIKDMVLMLPYNNEAAFELIEKHRDELAMVIIEPAQGSNPRDDVSEFLRKLRKLTLRHNILLCFDEIITGFRLALGGAQEYYGIEADISTYGKALGGGIPIGLVAGKKAIMDVIKGAKEKKSVFMGGTFSGNPLAMSVAKTVLQYLIKNREVIYSYLNESGEYVKDAVNNFCITNQLSMRIIGVGSMMRMIFTDKYIRSRRERDKYEADYGFQDLFYRYLLFEKGVYMEKNRIVLSMAHKKEHIEKVIQSFMESVEYFRARLKVS